MNSSRNINSDTFSAAVAELANQVDGPDGHWQPAPLLDEIAARIVAGIDGVPYGQHVDALVFAAKLKSLWDCVTDRDPSRKFDVTVGKLAGYAPSKAPEQVHAFATKLVERADGTEFADEWRVWALKQAAALKNAWSPKPELGNAADSSELEQDFVDVFTEAASGHLWLRAMISTPDRFLRAIEVSSGHERSTLEALVSMPEAQRRDWLESCIEREGENCRREGREYLDSDAICLSGVRDYHGDLHTCMLPMAAQVLLAYRHAPAIQQFALAA